MSDSGSPVEDTPRLAPSTTPCDGRHLMLTALVTLVLLAIAAESIRRGRGDTMAGAIIGFVAHYWLPPASKNGRP